MTRAVIRIVGRIAGTLLLLLTAELMPSSASAGRVTVTAEDADGRPVTVAVTARSSETAVGRDATTLVAGTAPLELTSGVWVLAVSSETWWSQEKTIVLRDGSDTLQVRFTVRPATWLSGRVAVRSSAAPPSLLDLTLRSVSESQAGPQEVRLGCAVANGSWRCQAPSGIWDIDVAAQGFVSHFFWDKAFLPANEVGLGTLQLHPGNEIVGQVVTAAGAPIRKACRVWLNTTNGEPLSAFLHKDKQRAQRPAGTQRSSFEVSTGVRGHYQLRQVPPGDYEIAARVEGTAEAKAEITVASLARTQVDPLVLQDLCAVEVVLTPPVGPDGEPWRLTLVRLVGPTSRGEAVESGAAVPIDGRYRRQGLAAGLYLIVVASADGGGWVHTTKALSPDSAPLSLLVPAVAMRGTITLGDKPLAAAITFRDPSGVDRQFSSDESGEFSGYIRSDIEAWEVRVRGASVTRTLSGVRPAVTGSEASVELKLPATTLRGVVVDKNDKPVKACIVSYQSLDPVEGTVETLTESEGRFSFEGLPPGRGLASARCRRRARGVEIVLTEGRQAHARLVLEDVVVVSGRVVGPDGSGVAGAELIAHTMQGTPVLTPGILGTTEVGGEFKLTIPEATESLAIRVAAQGYALRNYQLQVRPNTPLRAVLEKDAGTVALDFGGRALSAAPDYAAASLYLVHHGSIELVRGLGNWARNHKAAGSVSGSEGPGGMVLPDMAAGRYSLCALTLPEAMEFQRHASSCVDGDLAVGGTLNLTLPPPRGRE